MKTDLMFSSKTDQWATPQKFFDDLNTEFHFDVDVCAGLENHKCEVYFDEDRDGLSVPWSDGTYWCNPPYGRGITGKWVQKAHDDSDRYGSTVVMLLPARTDTRWFHDYIWKSRD